MLPWLLLPATAFGAVLVANNFQRYPGYQGSLEVEGSVNISKAGFGIQVVSYALTGVDPVCGQSNTSQTPNACGIHVHSGNTCEDAGGHFFNDSVGLDPWSLGPIYNASSPSAQVSIATGISIREMGGKVLVVHDSSGGRVACSSFQPHGDLAFWHLGGCYTEQDWRSQSWLNFTGAFRRCGPSAVCVAEHEMCTEGCFADEQCEMFPMRICDSQLSRCKHKPLFGAASGADVAAAIIFFLISGLALSAGIGGGGLYVPLLMVLLGFQIHEATGLSQSCLAGGASSALIYNLRQRHPSGQKPMIDYDLVLIMGPNLLLGAMVGSFLNFALPSWLILLLLITILVHSVFKTFKKALQTLRKEREGHVAGLKPGSDARLSKNPVERCLRLIGLGKRYAEFEERAPNAERPSVVGRSVDAGDVKLELDLGAGTVATKPVELTPSDQVSVQSLQSVHSEPQYPKGKLAGFLLMWLVVVVSILFRGGHAAPGIVSMCSPMYWAFALATAIILLLLSAASSCMAGQDAVQADGSLQWTLKTSLYVSVWSLLAGTMAALCGIGGGMIMGPKLLDLGCLPQVQSATTATTLFVMSTSTAIAFLVQGSATLDYSLWLGFATALGAVVGKAVVGWVVKRTQRPSVIMFLLGGIIALSVVVMSITGFIDVVDDLVQGNDLGFRDPCVALQHS
ncbi:Sulfite exporter TauE/SafE family protein 3 [Durusdinium trenchii]|uniref:Sulfite exporter TauE/SafE family protein 3 n=1 Tax=Durusdinium trenchii TaxID=1381693 RepID=A0ABP0MPQ8_9DINO